MSLYQSTSAVALVLLLASLLTTTEAQLLQQRPRRIDNAERPWRTTASGILTDRLTNKNLHCWNSIKRLAFAQHSDQQALHPTLQSLWQWIEQSGHAVYIEIISSSRLLSCTAGSFRIEQLDPQGQRHVAVIRLHPSNIDQAHVGPSAARAHGFIPFEGLSKEERYAEVLGHEMAHAVDVLSNPAQAQMVEEVVEQTNELLLSSHKRHVGERLGHDMRQRLIKRDRLLQTLEAQADSTETVVWRELVASRKVRAENKNRAAKNQLSKGQTGKRQTGKSQAEMIEK